MATMCLCIPVHRQISLILGYNFSQRLWRSIGSSESNFLLVKFDVLSHKP